jgi:GT2 family glycosyltransferase
VTISVVIPCFQSARHLKRCLDAVRASTITPLEVFVVDDGSTDDSIAIAGTLGAEVLRVPGGPRGPAAARNLGAARARGDVLLFLDADVAVRPDVIEKIAQRLDDHPEVAAIFGSYDDTPDHPAMLSQYRNLLHHFVHQRGQRDAFSFWAGCGAVRRCVFADLGGFDERYVRPSIEDIEFGGRLRAAGHRVWLCADLQATHLKRWTFPEIVRSDIRDRAIPWTRLIMEQAHLPQDLNTTVRSRLSAAAAWAAVTASFAALVVPGAVWVAVAALAALVFLNADLYGFFLRKRGLIFAVIAGAMHALYLLYSSAVFAAVTFAHLLRHGLRSA